MNNATPILMLVRGLPGSGKSHVARALQAALGTDRTVILDPDDIDQTSKAYQEHSAKLAAEGVDKKFHPYRFLRAKAHAGITAHKIIIWTQAFTDLEGFNKTVLNLQNYAHEHGTQLPLLVVEVEVSHGVAKERAAGREAQTGRSVPEEAFARFIRDYRSFANEGFNTVTVHGEDDVNASVKTIMKALEALPAPEA